MSPTKRELPANFNRLIAGASAAYDDGMFGDAVDRLTAIRAILLDHGRSVKDIDQLIAICKKEKPRKIKAVKPRKEKKRKTMKCLDCGVDLKPEEEEFKFCFQCLEKETE